MLFAWSIRTCLVKHILHIGCLWITSRPVLIQGGMIHWLFMYLYCRFKMQMVCMVLHWLLPLWLPMGTWIPPSDCSPWMQTLTNYWSTNSTTLISPKQMVRQGSDHKPNTYTFWSSKRLWAKCTFHIYPFLYPQKLMCHEHFWSFLELAFRNITPEFELIYNTAEEYGLKDLSPEAYADLVERWARPSNVVSSSYTMCEGMAWMKSCWCDIF